MTHTEAQLRTPQVREARVLEAIARIGQDEGLSAFQHLLLVYVAQHEAGWGLNLREARCVRFSDDPLDPRAGPFTSVYGLKDDAHARYYLLTGACSEAEFIDHARQQARQRRDDPWQGDPEGREDVRQVEGWPSDLSGLGGSFTAEQKDRAVVIVGSIQARLDQEALGRYTAPVGNVGRPVRV